MHGWVPAIRIKYFFYFSDIQCHPCPGGPICHADAERGSLPVPGPNPTPPPFLSSEWPTQIIHNIQRVTLSKVKLPCSAKSCLRALLSMLGQQNFEISRPIGLEHDQANFLHAFVNSIKMQHCIFLSRLKSDTIFTPSGLSIQHRKSAVGGGAKFVPFLSFHSKD